MNNQDGHGLSILLKAAKFLELQKEQEPQENIILETPNVINITPVKNEIHTAQAIMPQISNQIPINFIQKTSLKTNVSTIQPGQTVVITTSQLTPNIVQIKKEDSTPVARPVHPRHRILHNSFDIMNPLVIDESNEGKRRQPPLVFRSGTREVHNKLEKYRRAQLKECFDTLKKHLPPTEDKKTSNLSILHSAIKFIQSLKRSEKDLEHEMERLARDKIALQNKLAVLKKDLSGYCDIDKLLPEALPEFEHVVKNEPLDINISPSKPQNLTMLQPVNQNGNDRIPLPILPVSTAVSTPSKEVQQTTVPTTLSVLPMGYPLNGLNHQGLVVQKLIVPKNMTNNLMPTHFIAPQQLNGKVMPLVNQYVVKPVVVVSTPSPRPS